MSGIARPGPRARSWPAKTTRGQRARARGTLRPAPRRSGPASIDEARSARYLPIAGYSSLNAAEIVVRLRGLTQADLDCVYEYERSHQARPVVLQAIEARRIELPLPEYDELSEADLLTRLGTVPRNDLEMLRRYEQETKLRSVVLEEMDSRLDRQTAV